MERLAGERSETVSANGRENCRGRVADRDPGMLPCDIRVHGRLLVLSPYFGSYSCGTLSTGAPFACSCPPIETWRYNSATWLHITDVSVTHRTDLLCSCQGLGIV